MTRSLKGVTHSYLFMFRLPTHLNLVQYLRMSWEKEWSLTSLIHGCYLPHSDVVKTVVLVLDDRILIVSTTNVKDLAAATEPAYLVYDQ